MQQVLVVDDDAILQKTIVEILAEAGYQMLAASNGVEGLQVLSTVSSIGVVLSDMRMPEMDGNEFLRQTLARWPDTSVVMLTGHGSINSAVQAIRDGALNYLAKPFLKRELLDSVRDAFRIHSEKLKRRTMVEQLKNYLQSLGIESNSIADLIDQRSTTEGEVDSSENRFLQIHDLIIDQNRLAALYKGVVLELTPTEFEILYCLMQARERIVTFEDMAFRLRGVKVDRSEARVMLSSHLANLRAKLGKAGCGHYLVNSRGLGYYLNVDA